ncbi:hypothetical protein B5181_33730, partial [Streptomyces sp. 4F]
PAPGHGAGRWRAAGRLRHQAAREAGAVDDRVGLREGQPGRRPYRADFAGTQGGEGSCWSADDTGAANGPRPGPGPGTRSFGGTASGARSPIGTAADQP